jgi:hypothetical protein
MTSPTFAKNLLALTFSGDKIKRRPFRPESLANNAAGVTTRGKQQERKYQSQAEAIQQFKAAAYNLASDGTPVNYHTIGAATRYSWHTVRTYMMERGLTCAQAIAEGAKSVLDPWHNVTDEELKRLSKT